MNYLMNALIKVIIGLYMGRYDDHKIQLNLTGIQLKPIKFHCIGEHNLICLA